MSQTISLTVPPKLTSYLFGNRELIVIVADLLSASTEHIVNPANIDLPQSVNLAEQLSKTIVDSLEQIIGNYLKLCDDNQWQSIALQAISSGPFSVPVNHSALAFYQAINHYWSINSDSVVNKIMVYLDDEQFDEFTQTIESQINQDEATIHLLFSDPVIRMSEMEDEDNTPCTAYIDLSDVSNTDKDNKVDDEINNWFT